MESLPSFKRYQGHFVTPYLAIGGYPTPDDMADIEASGVRSILNVVAHCDKKAMSYVASVPETIQWRLLAFWDGWLGEEGGCSEELSVPYARLLVQWAAHELREHPPVLIHCMAGIGRSGNLAALLVAAKEHISPEEALERMRQSRPQLGNFHRDRGFWRQVGPDSLVALARTVLEEPDTDPRRIRERVLA